MQKCLPEILQYLPKNLIKGMRSFQPLIYKGVSLTGTNKRDSERCSVKKRPTPKKSGIPPLDLAFVTLVLMTGRPVSAIEWLAWRVWGSVSSRGLL